MLDLPRLSRIRLSARPFAQTLIGAIPLRLNYGLLPGVRIDVEGMERLPSGPVVFAMNHTDRYNYWPFQYVLLRRHGRFTATWVKGKYYEHPLLAAFMEAVNNIPAASRGYLITRDCKTALDRPPSHEEYESLRRWVEADAQGKPAAPPELASLAPVLTRPRNLMGLPFRPPAHTYAQAVNQLYDAMMARFVALNREAQALGLDLLVFPQGTRSLRLSKGHVGLAQIALHLGATIVPVGCSGSDKAYPGSSPWARRAHIVYRVGEPLTFADMQAGGAPRDFVPFSPAAEREHRASFQAIVDRVMERINGLVDPPYQFSDRQESLGVQGHRRFL